MSGIRNAGRGVGDPLDGQAAAGTLPPQDYEAICFGNAQRLYGLH